MESTAASMQSVCLSYTSLTQLLLPLLLLQLQLHCDNTLLYCVIASYTIHTTTLHSTAAVTAAAAVLCSSGKPSEREPAAC
jgi:hypothetical protein